MAVPLVVFFGCFIVGAVAAARWLPALAEGPVGGLAFFAVCGLLAAALGVLGLGVEQVVRSLESEQGQLGRLVVSDGLATAGRDAGMLFGLAVAVYLLAPRPEQPPPTEAGPPE